MTTTNTTLKGTIIFAALTIGGALMFVGSNDGEDAITELARGQAEQTKSESSNNSGDIQREQSQDTFGEFELEEGEVDDGSDWVPEPLIDNTEGFDPTPADEKRSSAGKPTDDTINETDAGDVYYEVKDRPIAGRRVNIPSTAKRPES